MVHDSREGSGGTNAAAMICVCLVIYHLRSTATCSTAQQCTRANEIFFASVYLVIALVVDLFYTCVLKENSKNQEGWKENGLL